MKLWRHMSALLVLTGLFLSGHAAAANIQIDGFTPVIGSASRNIAPLPAGTTTNAYSFSESGGQALLTLGGNGNTPGAVELIYNFSSPIDLTDGHTNDQFFMVLDEVIRPAAPDGSSALHVSISVTGGGQSGTYGTGMGEAPSGHSIALNFYCDVNPVCFSGAPDFTSVTQIKVYLAFPTNYADAGDTSQIRMDSIYVTPGGGSFPPEFTTAPASATYREGVAGSPVQFAATGIPEPDITLSGSLPPGVTWNGSTHQLGGTPAAGSGGVYSLQVKASSSVGTLTRAFTLTVEGPPSITSNASTTFQEGQLGQFTVTATGYPQPTLTLSGALPDGLSFSPAGELSGTPTNITGDGNYPLTVTASNGIGSNDTQHFTLTVNRRPTASGFTLNGQEDTPLTIPAMTFGITDPDGQTNALVLDSLPANGTLQKADTSAVSTGTPMNLDTLGDLTFVPDSNWSGGTSFAWHTTDGTLDSEPATATLNIAAVNDDPVIAEGSSASYTTDEDQSLSVTLNVSDAESTSFTLAAAQQPEHGTLSLPASGTTIAYNPDLNYHGTDSFVVTVLDGDGGSAQHTFNVTLAPVNDDPAIDQGDAITLTIDEDNSPTAFALQLDATDVEDGTADTLVWNLQTPASHGTASVAGTGASPQLDYSPDTNYNGNDSFVVRVTDSGGGHADFTVNLIITPFNDSPAITGTPFATAVENVPWSFTPTLDDPEGDALTTSITGQPAWSSFDSHTGGLSGTPSNADVGSQSNITLTVDDGNSTATLEFSVTVLADFDGDTIPDVDDSDIDNDGMTNDFETNAGLDPYDDSDADGDLDGDAVTNREEHDNGSDPTVDDYAPQLAAASTVHAEATGLFTHIELGELIAVDGLDGDIPATPDSGHFFPGAHSVDREATDQAGNTASTAQQVNITPQVSFGPHPVSAEGDTVTVRVFLNGPAITYPVTVPFTLSGSADAADHDLAAGAITIASGTEGSVDVTFVDDGAGEDTETLQLIMGTPTNAVPGQRTEQHIAIHENNVAPTVSLSASQNGRQTRLIIPADGPVTVTATASDANPADSLDTDWSASDSTLVDTDGDNQTFTFDPAMLDEGTHTVALTVSDGALSSDTTLALQVLATAPLLSSNDSDGDGTADDVEGFADADNDGVADYLDAMALPNVLQTKPAQASQSLLESDPGLQLRLGHTSLSLGDGGAALDLQTLMDAFNVNLPGNVHPHESGNAIDIVIEGLSDSDGSATLIVPQDSPIPANARFLVLGATDWKTLTTVRSAPGVPGYCPSPQDSRYRDGLHRGDLCVSLTVTDGSQHDADGKANGRISLRGGVVSAEASRESNLPPAPFGDGGSTAPLLLALLAALGMTRRRARAA
ncbi:MAG: tandem-95 repeat protein [Pseudomonadales bacterium]|nr:tandem-95 repeat protein [Pseudomonadales bacterium]